MRRLAIWGLVISAVVGGVISYYASSSPDGLERAAELLIEPDGTEPANAMPAPMPDYTVPGVPSMRISSGLAGVIGVAVTFGVCLVAGKLVSRRKGSE